MKTICLTDTTQNRPRTSGAGRHTKLAALRKFVTLAMAAASLAMFAPSAMAVATWDFGAGCTQNGTTIGNSFDACAASAGADAATGAVTVTTAQAFSTTAGGEKFAAGTVTRTTDGFGVLKASGGDSLAMDNKDDTDTILLTFSSNVVLSQLTLNAIVGDSDISVLRYTGTGTPTASLIANSPSTLVAGGWASVGNFLGDASAPSRTIDITGGASSSWWLISAYNKNYIGGTDQKPVDEIRLFSAAGTKAPTGGGGNQTPEPGSLALVGVALAGMLAVRRRVRQDA